jgi:hypothetical protein
VDVVAIDKAKNKKGTDDSDSRRFWFHLLFKSTMKEQVS